MVKMIFVFVLLTLFITAVQVAWSSITKEERALALKALAKGAIFSGISTTILFIIVTLF